MPVNVQRGPISYQPLELEPVELDLDIDEYSWWERVGDSYLVDSWMGQTALAFQTLLERERGATGQPYDGLDNIPKGYEQYADAFAYARNERETNYIVSRIDRTNEARGRLNELPTMNRLAVGLFTGVVDPINFFGGPTLKGAGFLAGAGRGALAIGSINAGTELVRHSLDPTSTVEETAINIGFGYALAGLIGGGIGHFTRKSGDRVGTISLSREQRARAEQSGDDFARAVNAVDGVAVIDEIRFDGQGVRIIDGPTGKVDGAGNPVRAFYRSKEAQEEIRYRDRVSRAADDALGDVIPDAVDAPPPRPDLPENLDDLAQGAVRAGDDAADEADAALPLGGRGGDDAADPGARGARGGDDAEELEDVIYIDTAAIRAEFESKPWTRPRYPGIEPFADDAFKTEAEWLNFVTMHELYHATTKRLPGESVAEYENRINRLAYEDIQGGRLPFSPTDGALEKLAMLPTPSGTLMRLAPRNADVHGLAQTIAGDMSTLTLANRAGQPTTATGSVFQKANRWLKEYFVAHVAMRQAYARYVHGKASDSNFMQAVDVLRAQMPVIGQGRASGKLTYDEFRDFIGRAVFTDKPFEVRGKALSDEHMGIVREAAHEIQKVLDKFQVEARNLGMFDRARELQREIEWRIELNERAAARLDAEARPGIAEKINDEIIARKAEIEEMQELLEELADQPLTHRAGEAYFPRIYDIGAIRERYDDFVDILAAAFAREAGQSFDEVPPRVVSAKQARTHEFETGKPVVVEGMHGSYKEIESFEPDARGSLTEAPSAARAFFFTSRKKTAEYYASFANREQQAIYIDRLSRAKALGEDLPPAPKPTVNRRYIKLNNPYVFDMKGKIYREETYNNILIKAEADGHDGVIIRRTYDSGSNNWFDTIMVEGRFQSETIIAAFEGKSISKNPPASSVRDRAKKVADNIIGEGVEEGTFGFGGPRQLRSRVLPITNEEVADFIITDPMRVMGVYARRMGAAIEMQRQFGSRDLAKQLAELKERLRDQGFSEKKITDILWEMEAMRDRVLGQFHGKDPLSWDNRVARAIKNFGSLTLMGRGIYAQTVDMARTLAAEGYKPMFAALRTAMGDGMKGVKPGVYSREAGEAMEMVMSRVLAQLIENDSALLVTKQTKIERGLAAMQAPFFNMNLMNPFTVMWKDFTSLMSAHRLIGDSKVLADAVAAGRTKATFTKKEAKIMAELASWGIDLRGAQQIASMPAEKSGGGLWMANLGAWEGQGLAGQRAREQFLGALSGSLRTNVVTPGPLQRAAIMDGVFQIKKGGKVSRLFADGGDRLELPLLSLPFQLLSFSMASSAKVTHAMLSGRDRNRLVTLSTLLAGGMFSTWLASGDDWDRMSIEEIIYSTIERSGITGWIMEPFKRGEALSDMITEDQVGPRSAMSLYEFGQGEINDEVGAVGGPSLGIMAGIVDALTAPDIDDDRRAKLLLRAIPMSGLVWFGDDLKEMASGAAEAGLIDIDVDPADSADEVQIPMNPEPVAS